MTAVYIIYNPELHVKNGEITHYYLAFVRDVDALRAKEKMEGGGLGVRISKDFGEYPGNVEFITLFRPDDIRHGAVIEAFTETRSALQYALSASGLGIPTMIVSDGSD